MTYPLYLLHIPTLIFLVWLSLPRGATAIVFGFIASIAVSWVAYQAFETRVALLRARVRGFRLGHDLAEDAEQLLAADLTCASATMDLLSLSR